MQYETRKLSDLKLWDKNPRSIKEVDLARLKVLITRLGLFKPFLITSDGTILGGNMRFRACQELGLVEVPVSVVEAKTETQQLEFALADNDRAGSYDELSLKALILNSPELDQSLFKIDLSDQISLTDLFLDKGLDDTYTKNIEAPTYEPKNEKPEIEELYDNQKMLDLIAEIKRSNLDEKTKDFLTLSAYRHCVFNYQAIADFYANSEPEVQDLMEKSALVIIDFNKAIENGYVRLSQDVTETFLEDKDD